MGDGAIALGDRFAPVPWHLRVNLDVEVHYCISVLINSLQKEGLGVSERQYNKRIIDSEA